LKPVQDTSANSLTYLVDSLTHLESIIGSAHDAIVSVNAQGQIIMFNKGAKINFGYDANEVLGEPVTRLMPERFASKHAEHMQEFMRSKETSRRKNRRSEIVGQRKDGSEFPAEASISKLDTKDGLVLTIILRDTTERRQAEQTQERLLAILEKSTDIVGTADPDGNLLYLNQAGREFSGIGKSGDIKGLRMTNFHEGWALSKLLHEGIPYAIRDGSWEGESEICKPNGESIPISQLILAHKNGNGDLLFLSSVMRDISESKLDEDELLRSHRELKEAYGHLEETQSQLLQSEKMASIGQLAAGVAHEINNPIGYINSNLSSLKQYIDNLWQMLTAYQEAEKGISDENILSSLEDLKREVDLEFLREDTAQLVDESMEGISRVKNIVQDLKDFSHVDEDEWQWTDLHMGLDSTLNIVNNEIKYKAEVLKEYGDIPEVECIGSQLNQVFMNMLVNAAHAIEERGTITIRTGTNDDNVWIEIEDSGKGMSEEVQKRIFDPFYTTKPVGKGTGLGLSLSYGIIQKHQGDIKIESEPGKGTTFHITVPIQGTATDEVDEDEEQILNSTDVKQEIR